MSRLHPVFHVVKLLPVPDDPHARNARPPPPPTVVDGELEYDVEEVLDSRLFRGKLEFLVKWKGYGYEENSWVREGDVHAQRLVNDFYRRHPGAPRRIRALTFDHLAWTPTLPPHSSHRDAAPWRGGDVRGTPLTGLLTTSQDPLNPSDLPPIFLEDLEDSPTFPMSPIIVHLPRPASDSGT